MKTQALLILVAITGAPVLVSAQESKNATPLPAATTEPAQAQATAEPAPPQKVQAVVRGLYIEGTLGGGYMVNNAKNVIDRKPDDKTGFERKNPIYSQAPAADSLGTGSTVQMAVGYDLTDFLALQAVGGAFMVSSMSDREPVRDLGMVFGGVGARGGVGLSDRLRVNGSAALAYVSADNHVEAADAGVAVLVGAGLEYYVHVRHFSVGLELSAFVPFSPMRVFIGLAPSIKYTF